MKRRDFFRSSVAAAAAGLANGPLWAAAAPCSEERTSPRRRASPSTSPNSSSTRSMRISRSDVLELGKKSMLDGFGLALAGSASVMGPLVREYLKNLGVTREEPASSGLPSRRRRASPPLPMASRFTPTISTIHSFPRPRIASTACSPIPRVPALPPAFAFAKLGTRSGKDFMLAYHVGVEVETKIAEAISPRHYNDGFHTTGTCGSFGSTAACAKLRATEPDADRLRSRSRGSRGRRLARQFRLDDQAVSRRPRRGKRHRRRGSGRARLDRRAGHSRSAARIFPGRGRRLRSRFHRRPAGKALDLRIAGRFHQAVSLGFAHPSGHGRIARHDSQERHQARARGKDRHRREPQHDHHSVSPSPHDRDSRASSAWSSASAFCCCERKAGLIEFTDAVVQRPDVQAMIPRVNFYVDPEAEAAGFDKMTSILKIHLKDGRVISGRAEFAKGSPANPMSYDEVADKFRGCAEFAKWPSKKSRRRSSKSSKSLESAPDMNEPYGRAHSVEHGLINDPAQKQKLQDCNHSRRRHRQRSGSGRHPRRRSRRAQVRIFAFRGRSSTGAAKPISRPAA